MDFIRARREEQKQVRIQQIVDAAAIIAAVEKAGYGASRKDTPVREKGGGKQERIADQQIRELRQRLLGSLVFLLPLMYVVMHGHWGGIVPDILR